jgi:hypothetical protein
MKRVPIESDWGFDPKVAKKLKEQYAKHFHKKGKGDWRNIDRGEWMERDKSPYAQELQEAYQRLEWAYGLLTPGQVALIEEGSKMGFGVPEWRKTRLPSTRLSKEALRYFKDRGGF